MAEPSGNVEYLDTSKFSAAITAFKKGVEEYNSIKTGVQNTTTTLFTKWQGEGKKQFEKDYNTIFQQLTDIADILYELYDALVEAQATYIQTDEEMAKLMTIE